MTSAEVKYILAAYRPNGRDADDPLFAEALAQANRDPVLRAWFMSQHAFDTFICARVSELQPPAGLRATAVIGARMSLRPKPRRRGLLWLAFTAIILVLVGIGTARRSAWARPDLSDLTRFALRDAVDNGSSHSSSIASMRELELRLASMNFRSDPPLHFDLDRLRQNGCRAVRVPGSEVFEICFGENHEFHLYIARANEFARRYEVEPPKFNVEGGLSAATWADSRFGYSLVAKASPSLLQERF